MPKLLLKAVRIVISNAVIVLKQAKNIIIIIIEITLTISLPKVIVFLSAVASSSSLLLGNEILTWHMFDSQP